MTLHVVGLPHTSTTRRYEWCAYTAKTRRFATMMTGQGYDVRLYAGPDNEADCKEHVECISTPEQRFLFGDGIPDFDPRHPGFDRFNRRAIAAITERAQPGDILCLIGGTAQAPIADAFPAMTVAEWGVGYGGVLDRSHRCFESYAWMHAVYAQQAGGACAADGRFYDVVIPNSYDPADFPAGDGHGDYLLYVGRLIDRKGLAVVRDVAARIDIPLVVAGAGDESLIPPGATYEGVVGPARRAELMGAAVALIAPTLYVEPFGGVAVEAQMCGTPAITTPFGAFTETVEDGVTGFRCHTLAEFCAAVDQAPSLDRAAIRQRAIGLYSADVAAAAYSRWFDRLDGLHGAGWYA